jgi:DNA-directed RNA polymerase subunit alpha
VTSIRIEGVLHEFSTVAGVKEDVTDIILNLKELVVSSEQDEPVVMYLRKQGPGEVTATDIAPPAGVEVHNPGMHIATLNSKGKLEMELTVERGRGYVSAAQKQAARAGDRPDPHRLDLLAGAPGHLQGRGHPGGAADRLRQADHRRGDQALDAATGRGGERGQDPGRAVRPGEGAQRRGRGIDIGPSPTDAALAADLALPIEELTLTVRSYNCLKREGIHTVGELVARSEQDLLDIRNFGAKSIEEVKQKLTDMGLALKDSPPGFDPGTAVDNYAADDDESYVETEQY